MSVSPPETVYEANGKPRTGILTGHDGDLGNFDQCLQIETNGDYRGKYCLISVQTALADTVKSGEVYQQNLEGLSDVGRFHVEFNLGTIYGLCIPNSCNLDDLLNSINRGKARSDLLFESVDRFCD